MRLFLLRHADADTVALSDEARCLSEKGLGQARRVARFCATQELIPSLILSSPVQRAHETALIVSAHLRTELVVVPWLACGMNARDGAKSVLASRERGSVMVVGHEPDLGLLIGHFLGLSGRAQVEVRKASLTLLETDSPRPGTARLLFTIQCKMM